MILTGSSIRRAIHDGTITFDPFHESAINPNSVNYRLGGVLCRVDQTEDGATRHVQLSTDGGRFLLKKGNLYLGHTMEIIGSHQFVASLIGRSSIGRLGLFVQVSANLGHMGAVHRWTLELVPTLDVYLYPGQNLGQVSFWMPFGDPLPYVGWFGQHDLPMPSKYHDPQFLLKGNSDDPYGA